MLEPWRLQQFLERLFNTMPPEKEPAHTTLRCGEGEPLQEPHCLFPILHKAAFSRRPSCLHLPSTPFHAVRQCSGFWSPLMFFLDQSLPLPRILCSWITQVTRKESLQRPTTGGSCSCRQKYGTQLGVSASQLTASGTPFPQGQQGPSSQRGFVV